MTDNPVQDQNADTDPASSASNQTPEEKGVEPVEKQPQEDPNSEEFNSLKGNTQDRIRQLIRERDQYKDQIARFGEQDSQTVDPMKSRNIPDNPQPSGQMSEGEVNKAVDILVNQGHMATKQDVMEVMNRMKWDRQHEILEDKYNGSDGLPKYTREEVEDYARRHKLGDPQAAFRNMYWDEFMDNAQKKSKAASRTYTEPQRSADSSRQQPETLNTFRDKLGKPGGREYLEKLLKNPEKSWEMINELQQTNA